MGNNHWAKVVFFLEASRGQGQCPLICFVGSTSEKVGDDNGSYRGEFRALLNQGARAGVRS